MSNVNVALQQLEQYNKRTGLDIFVPSLGKTLKFKSITLVQQKALLKSTIDESLTKLAFNLSISDIIKQNCLEEGVDTDNLFVFDRTAITVALRAKCLDNRYTVNNNNIDLNIVTENYKNIPLGDVNEKTLEHENFSLSVAPPKISDDRRVSQLSLKKVTVNQDTDLKSILGELFVLELVKFIKRVTLKETSTVVDFSQISAEDAVKLAEQLPSQLVTKLLDYIKLFRDFESKYTVTGENIIDVDGSFFTI